MQHKDSFYEHQEQSGPQKRQACYSRYISGCYAQSNDCENWESERIEMNLMQPRAMVNYTNAGYAKVETPRNVHEMLTDVWQEYHEQDTHFQYAEENWEAGNSYVNHWESPTYMLDLTDYLSETDRLELIVAVQSVLEAWTQQPLTVTSLYGIRVYKEGAILAPHVDRLPLVSSAILHVAHDPTHVDEPWILEVIGHDGKARNVTMEAGDMLLYESHSVIHGRPYALKGSYYANVFVHFEPLGHTQRHSQQQDNASGAKEAYQQALEREQRKGDVSSSSTNRKKEHADLPPYVSAHKEMQWNQQYDFVKNEKVRSMTCLLWQVVIESVVISK
jgi:prolyl 4-hydroxylase